MNTAHRVVENLARLTHILQPAPAFFFLNGTYSFGSDSTGTAHTPGQGTCAGQTAAWFTQCKQWSAIAKYTGPRFGAIVAYDERHGGPGASANLSDGIAPEPLSAGTDTDRHLLLSGYLKVSTLTLSTGWISRTVNFSKALPSTVRTRLWFAGTSWNIAPDIVWATQLYRIANPEHDTRATLVTTRAMYLLSKASALYVQVGYLTTVPMSRTAYARAVAERRRCRYEPDGRDAWSPPFLLIRRDMIMRKGHGIGGMQAHTFG
ncbi:porin family protein [Paraburkholderia xenovorans]|uniref:hypothetical protein n=1 Tax=Paraburkholderia xenovorans TaxID=36873 RepID=UPI000037EB82|nr:hypothetical protein [Paraburkholderia xenovorans]